MSELTTFQDLMRRVRAGDGDAAAELVRSYEPAIRRVVRLRLGDARLRRVFDSADVCQSVLASFFARLALGQYVLRESGQLAALLLAMARTKVARRARRAEVRRRDRQGQEVHAAAMGSAASPGPGPCRLAAGRDLLEQFQRRLTAEKRLLSDRRVDGRSWSEIADELGGSPDALRKRWARALDRVSIELGLDEPDDE